MATVDEISANLAAVNQKLDETTTAVANIDGDIQKLNTQILDLQAQVAASQPVDLTQLAADAQALADKSAVLAGSAAAVDAKTV